MQKQTYFHCLNPSRLDLALRRSGLLWSVAEVRRAMAEERTKGRAVLKVLAIVGSALMRSDAGGEKHALKGKRLGLVIVFGGTDPFSSGAMNAYAIFRDIAAFFCLKIVGVVYGSAMAQGEIAKKENILEEARSLGRTLCGQPGKGEKP